MLEKKDGGLGVPNLELRGKAMATTKWTPRALVSKELWVVYFKGNIAEAEFKEWKG